MSLARTLDSLHDPVPGLPSEIALARWGSAALQLGGALADKQFELVYQSVIDLLGNSVAGFEALLRWRHPERGLVSPAEFIPVIEDIGLIVPIGEWVIRRACEDAATWPVGMKVSVNLSPTQFVSYDLPGAVRSILEATGVDGDRLEFEITAEAACAHVVGGTHVIFEELQKLGVRIACDHADLATVEAGHLRRFPFDRAKLAPDLVRDLATSPEAADSVGIIARACARDGIAVTGTAVETQAQLAGLLRAGVVEAQGYLFDQPGPAWAIPDAIGRIEAMLQGVPAA